MFSMMNKLDHLAKNNLIRQRRIINRCNDRLWINFANNDYLGLAQDSRVQAALITGATEFGFGSGSSAMISGFSRYHYELEEQFAAFLGSERALLFNSGYHANLGVITSFAQRNTPVIADKYSHASIIDAITLARAAHFRYRHNDINHADALLAQHATGSAIMITESVYSMSGIISPVAKLAALAKRHQAMFLVDDAHGFGVLGRYGRGAAEYYTLSSTDIALQIIPLGKALGGMGAIVAGNRDIIEYLLQKARTYCYSTALPPAICAANLRALQIIQAEPQRVERLHALSAFFIKEAALRNLPLVSADLTPIKCLLSGTNQATLALQEKLMVDGYFVAAIRPPTVPENNSRIRISLSINHTEKDITTLLDLLAEHYDNPAA